MYLLPHLILTRTLKVKLSYQLGISSSYRCGSDSSLSLFDSKSLYPAALIFHMQEDGILLQGHIRSNRHIYI